MISLEETIKECINNKEFMREYERLNKVNFSITSPIIAAIDNATGYDKKRITDLFDFIKEYIWLPLMVKGFLENKERDKQLYNFGLKTPNLSKKGKKMFKQAIGERNPI